MQVIGDEREDSARWPLHERLAGAAVRALCVAIAVGGASALGSALAWDHWYHLMSFVARDALEAATVALACAFAGFALEQRDATPIGGTVRLAASAIAASIALVVAIAWLDHAERGFTDPVAAFRRLIDVLVRGDWFLIRCSNLTIVIGPILVARRLSDRFRPQLAAGLASALLFLWIDDDHSVRCRGDDERAAIFALAAGTLVPAASAIGDRLARRIDPRAPRARATQRWLVLFTAGVLLVPWVAISRAAVDRLCLRYRDECAAIGALKTITTSQSIFRDADKDGDGVLNYAASLGELGDAQLIDGVLASGVKQGYVFRLTRSATSSEFLWCAAADPIAPRVTGDRHFFVNQHAVIFYTTTREPFAIDPETCAIPERAIPCGE